MARHERSTRAPTPATSRDAGDAAGDLYYSAFVAHDARFDGRVFVGVTSTGIYCRPVCRVRTPKRNNCRFFGHAAAAEQAGFRPCLRCRPELAPGLSLVDSSRVLASQAARMIEQQASDGADVYLPAVANQLGVTDRHLRRIFQDVHGVSPMDFLTTRRLLLAKQLLTDTTLPVTQVALASGFSSLRRFNAAFLSRYRLCPSALRRQGRDGAVPGLVTLRLAYRPPCDTAGLLRFFSARALPGVEAVDGHGVRRTLALDHQGQRLSGWVAARFVPARHEVEIQLAPALLPALGAVLQRVRHAFDLDADPALVDPVMDRLPASGLVRARPGIRLPGGLDGFEIAARTILGQQVSVGAARTLTLRLVGRFGDPVLTPFPDLNRLFPDAATLAAARPDAIGRLGIVRQRVRALQALATAVAEGRIALHRGAPLAATLDALRALPGIGEWTTELIAMRALAWPDAFPASDIGVLNALGTRDVRRVRALAEDWRPWRSYAVIRLWQTLEK
ncbi:MAG: helix-turn-helix domain-containing protein [Gammaproteobacteria bacterium]|nr:helix-turn-helix domain-containing protein [Gammaproteobacteria bacterium]